MTAHCSCYPGAMYLALEWLKRVNALLQMQQHRGRVVSQLVPRAALPCGVKHLRGLLPLGRLHVGLPWHVQGANVLCKVARPQSVRGALLLTNVIATMRLAPLLPQEQDSEAVFGAHVPHGSRPSCFPQASMPAGALHAVRSSGGKEGQECV